METEAEIRTGFVYDEIMERHRGQNEHPECPARIRTIFEKLQQSIWSKCVQVKSRKATQEELETTHSSHHINFILQIKDKLDVEGTAFHRFQNDEHTYASRDSADAALCAIGSVIDLSERVLNGDLDNGFAIVRPPGHHACADKSMGFCLLNNVAVVANVLIKKHNVQRVLIVDWDVHHGNGTCELFESSSQVLYMSLHRWEKGSFYPGTGDPEFVGKGSGMGYTVNIGWNHTKMDDVDYNFAMEHAVLPIAREFKPEIVLVSCGFDAADGDEHGDMKLSPRAFGRMTQQLKQLADGKIVMILEGGYHLQANVESVQEVMNVLMDFDDDTNENDLSDETPTKECVDDVLKTLQVHLPYWKSVTKSIKDIERCTKSAKLTSAKSRREPGSRHVANAADIHIPRAPRRTAEAKWKDSIFKCRRTKQELEEKLAHILKLKEMTKDKKNKLSKRDYAEIGNEEKYMFELDEVTEELSYLTSLSKEDAILLFTSYGK